MQFDIELIQHEYFCKCIFLKIIAISKWSGYVLFEFNPLVMVHSLSIQYLSRASNVKTSPLTTSMAKNFISLTLWPFEEKCWYSLGFSNSSSCTNLLCWPGPLSPSDILLFSLHIEACDCISDIQNFLHIELLNIMYCLTSSEYLNWYRYNHEANGVKWDSGLTYKAYEATNAMCARGFDHHPGTEAEYGSLWAHSNRCEDVSGGALVTALQNWYSECPLYTGESSWQSSGHFTQMVWRKSTKYGMWAQSCSSPDG